LWIYVHNDKNYAWIEQHVNKLGTKDGIEYREIENGDYFLEKPSGGEAKLAEASWLFSIPKPTSSEYTLNITSNTPTFTPVEIIAYGNNATHKKLIKNIFVSPTSSRIISIGYNRENVNNLTMSLKSSYLTLREGVKFAQSRNWLHHSLSKHFLNLIDLSEKFSYKRKHTSQILLGVIDQQLDMAYKMRKISKLGYELIKGELQSLIEHK